MTSRRAQRRHRHSRASTRTLTWIELPTGARVAVANHIVGHIREILASGRRPELNQPLQPASQWHVDRLCHALADIDRDGDDEWDNIDDAYFAYADTVDHDEHERMFAAFNDFAIVVMNMPSGATCPGDWFRHVKAHGIDQGWLLDVVEDDT